MAGVPGSRTARLQPVTNRINPPILATAVLFGERRHWHDELQRGRSATACQRRETGDDGSIDGGRCRSSSKARCTDLRSASTWQSGWHHRPPNRDGVKASPYRHVAPLPSFSGPPVSATPPGLPQKSRPGGNRASTDEKSPDRRDIVAARGPYSAPRRGI
jgi:hypothetical protein